MMEESEIKLEFDNYSQVQCHTCLSIGRKLFPLGKFVDIYKKIITNYMHFTISRPEELQVCWECHMLLHKAVKFQQRVEKANEILQLGQSYIHGSLSSLTTILLSDVYPQINTIYVDSQIDITDIQNNITDIQNVDANITIENKIINEVIAEENIEPTDFHEETSNLEEIKPKIEGEEIKKTKRKTSSQNRWAIKRALQNKKPKFEIISNTDINDLFRRVHIDIEELQRFLKNKLNSKRYRQKKYKCELCIIGFKDENALMKHNKNNHNEDIGPLTCDICTKRFADKRHLATHVKKHYYKYQCTVCPYCCFSKKMKVKHMEAHKKIFQCLKCGLRYSNRREFYMHFKEWHERFICDHCGISFKMKYCIKDHIRKQHSPYECKPCNKRFARYNGLWLHNKTAHSSYTASAYCVECDKYYDNVYRYRWHIANSARHTPRKQHRYPCPSCSKVFVKNIYMKDHYNLVHLKQYKYRCETCNKNFIRNADLNKHRRRVHEGILPPKNKICYICGRGFTTNKILSNHVRTHTGERPFACQLCPARFAQRAALVGHARAKHKDVEKTTNAT